MNLDGVQTISSAYVFGAAGLAFASLPFLFVVIRGAMKARDNTARHSGIVSIFIFAFVVHIVSCAAFMVGIKILDITSPVGVKDYFSNIVFDVFWASDKMAAFGKVGLGVSSPEAEGAWVILHGIQVVRDFGFMLLPIICVVAGMAYGNYQSQKDTYQTDLISSGVWTVIGGVIAYFMFGLWVLISQYALFLPNGTLWDFISSEWQKLLTT